MSRRSTGADAVREWDRWWDGFVAVVPWVLLLPSAALVLLSQPVSDWTGHAVTIGLTALASAWVLLGYVPPWRDGRPLFSGIHFAVLLVLASALMAHDGLFLMFTISLFFRAMALPRRLTFVGIAATSIALYTTTMGIPGTSTELPFLEHLFIYVGVVTIQTVAIGGGLVVASKTAEQHRERRVMVARLEAALEENAGLHAQLLTQAREAGVLDERQRMAREIHDTLAQGLTGIVTQIQAAQRVWETPGAARPHVDRSLDLARESLTEARRSVQALRPRQLAESQLPEALNELTRRWAEEHGVRPDLDVTGERVALSPAIEVVLFRVAQEALTNVARHADASRVGVTLSYSDDVVMLDVRDDGRGITGHNQHGFGLSSMRQRVRGIGGTVEIESDAGEGTAVSATVPAIPVGAE
ncbi:sensor histidine kinase [Nocardiopsis alborubida]|uniref:Oxygen sensor histidine kinase NreB n=1 Tax=Nocardiopsis alborubida TaxID=146802 RepID=A0A7X6MCR0_9ACTN|nr:sensor histidine kinase [Nocardiopsis alborubida]NKY99033.1 sensor histidine kinase [Nocardiopsis alborubida]